jgi:ABC-type lipoprotein export system ATPase subunit
MSSPMLAIESLRKSFRGPRGSVSALDEVTLAVEPGEFVAVRGPSGCGKTTLLLAAGGLLRPDAGTVRVGGQDLYALRPEERARFRGRHIGFVFQQFHLVPYLSVRENVLAAAMAAGAAGGNGSRRERYRRADELIARFGLAHRARHVPAALSTGERQRAALARALLNAPVLLLADEPTGNLDAGNGETVLAALAEFARAGGAVLLVTHDPSAARHATRALELAAGRVRSP